MVPGLYYLEVSSSFSWNQSPQEYRSQCVWWVNWLTLLCLSVGCQGYSCPFILTEGTLCLLSEWNCQPLGQRPIIADPGSLYLKINTLEIYPLYCSLGDFYPWFRRQRLCVIYILRNWPNSGQQIKKLALVSAIPRLPHQYKVCGGRYYANKADICHYLYTRNKRSVAVFFKYSHILARDRPFRSKQLARGRQKFAVFHCIRWFRIFHYDTATREHKPTHIIFI